MGEDVYQSAQGSPIDLLDGPGPIRGRKGFVCGCCTVFFRDICIVLKEVSF